MVSQSGDAEKVSTVQKPARNLTPQNMPSSESISEEENKINTYVVFVRG